MGIGIHGHPSIGIHGHPSIDARQLVLERGIHGIHEGFMGIGIH